MPRSQELALMKTLMAEFAWLRPTYIEYAEDMEGELLPTS